MKKLTILIALISISLLCKAQVLEDPSRGVKLYILVTTTGSNRPTHYGSFEEMDKIDFSKISLVSIENRGRKGKMDTLLLYKLINNSPNLASLTIGRNVMMEHFPKIEKDNNSLKSLHLIGNDLGAIPEGIDRLKALELFACRGNKIKALPDDFTHLKSLSTLLIGGNEFRTFPAQIFELDHLTTLSFDEEINAIPEEIEGLAALKKISLSTKHISSLPKAFSELKNLHFIDLSDNKFANFPSQLLKLPKLKYLAIWNNPITKAAFLSSIKGLKTERLNLYSSLKETERLELEKTYPQVKFGEEMMPFDIERIVVE